ncbi:MAG: SPOR domain-containing protein [Flavobacteriaceae bacterium]|nr:SPOR domain-containing protein [Mangrovimonas sp.]MCB0470684.1 SPOR domain-containing protein [Flavobacteriaceae bacterium]MCB0436241.1 SPOR domain-containing protein [Mangrovimonas sp.]MCB0437568.1 SPOR domain-containing protein [Mangrovimonas sp.]HPF96760.1 SPOR domain-containing protein [Mangrovimonas sp.]
MKILRLKSIAFLALFLLLSLFKINAQTGQLEVHQDPEINELLALKKDINTADSENGKYRIQIYSGNRTEAEKTMSDYKNKFSNWKSTMVYETPNYKVWVGSFMTRLEADRALVDIQTKFNGAFVFKPKPKEK